jgi:two-component system, NarL family, invasion response regulator UvrY
MSDTSIRVMSVEDNDLVADAIGRKLSADPAFEWLGWAKSRHELMRAVAQRSPHVVCMDLDIPGEDVLGMIGELRNVSPGSRVLILTGHVREEFVRKTLDAGAWGYLSKAEESRVIVESIRRVARGEIVLGRLTKSELSAPIHVQWGKTPAAKS